MTPREIGVIVPPNLGASHATGHRARVPDTLAMCPLCATLAFRATLYLRATLHMRATLHLYASHEILHTNQVLHTSASTHPLGVARQTPISPPGDMFPKTDLTRNEPWFQLSQRQTQANVD